MAFTAPSCPHCGYLPPQPEKGLNVTAVALGLGGLMIAGGSFLPWLTITSIGSVSRSGFDGGSDGFLSLGLGTVLVLIALANLNATGIDLWSRVLSLLAGIGGLILFAAEGADIAKQINAVSGVFTTGSIGAGLYVVAVGSGAVILTAILGVGRESAAAR